MSLLAELKVNPGSGKVKKRKGRGKGSGKGGTSTRGHKGQRARKSGNAPAGFEGGAMPLARRLPKFGFNNARFKKEYSVINLSLLKDWKEDVTPEKLVEKGLIKKGSRLKILASGDLTQGLTVKAHKFSKTAEEKIKKAGGKVENLVTEKKQVSKGSKKEEKN